MSREDRLDFVGKVLQTITYRPSTVLNWSGSELDISDSYPDAYSGEMKEFVWCAGHPPVSVFETDDLNLAERLVFDWVFENLAMTELHEVAEYLRLDGVRVHDPHPLRGKDGSPVKVELVFPSGHVRALDRIP